MSSPDERQGDERATCSSYSCKEGPEHSISCDKIDRSRSESLEASPPSQVPTTRQSPAESTSSGGLLISGNGHTEVPGAIEETAVGGRCMTRSLHTFKGCS
jgi:hypothetical protein